MTLAQAQSTSGQAESRAYPTLLRLGHRYETTLGQLNALGRLRGAVDLILGNDGWIYVLNRGSELPAHARLRIVRLNAEDQGYDREVAPDPDKTPAAPQKGSLAAPVMGVLDQDGVFFVTDEKASTVNMFKSTGEAVGWWGETGTGPGQLEGPAGIALDGDGTLWIADSRNHRVQHFTRDGRFLACWGGFGSQPGELNFPWGIAVDPIDGTLVVSDWRNDRIQRFSRDGRALMIIGRSGTGAGELNRPSGVTVDHHGDIYVADRNNHRVLLFNRRGLFVETFIGDATLNEQGIQRLMGNPNMLRQRDNVSDLDREKRFKFPAAIKTSADGLVFILDAGRHRIQVYRKLCRVLRADEVDAPELHLDPMLN
ncbi:MAG: NHL repeat-containing protein [Chloroflexi bacterium]|nr:NHL repeat-containing protein [Chloroflexota bacterium]